MMKKSFKYTRTIAVTAILACLGGCSVSAENMAKTQLNGAGTITEEMRHGFGGQPGTQGTGQPGQTQQQPGMFGNGQSGMMPDTDSGATSQGNTLEVSSSATVFYAYDDAFSNRDLAQEADLTDATTYTVKDNETITINAAGVYVINGSAKNASIVIEAGDEDKVQIVLNGVNVTNDSTPVIYVKNADKVFVTTAANTTNKLSVTGTFTADGDTNTDAVIFSKDDLTLNGLGTLTINSTDNGITSKDDMKITGGTYNITSTSDALEANDSIQIADGTFTIQAGKDALHAENDEDDTLGYVFITGGTFDITASDDAIQANSVLQIDNGTMNLSGGECLEATYVQVNDGNITIKASDDGINASQKSYSYTPTVEINGGSIDITMGSGDTDAIDANGNLIIRGGTINISAQSAFDFDGSVSFTGGSVYVNGSQVTSITNSMMGGMQGMRQGMQNGQGNMPNGQGGMMPGMQGGRR